MKIALTCPASIPATPFGGILIVSINFAKQLASVNHDVTIYTTDLNFSGSKIIFDKELPRIEKINGFTIKRSHPFFRIFMFFVNPQIYFLLKNDKPDLIHTIGCRSFQSFMAALVSRIHKIPLIVSDYGGITTHPDIATGSLVKKIFYQLQSPLLKFVIGQASKIIAANEYEIQDFVRFTKKRNITVLPTGIDFETLQKCPFDFKSKHNITGRIILFVGRFNKVKGIDLLLKAYSEICKEPKLSDVILIIMGSDFGFESTMKKMIEELDIKNRLKIIRNPERDEVISAYHACEFLVLPSRWELSPLTPLEGFACKKPSISTNIAGIPCSVEDGKNGILFPYENIDEISKSMMKLLEDKEQIVKLGENGYELVKNKFDSRIIQENLLKIYDEVIKD